MSFSGWAKLNRYDLPVTCTFLKQHFLRNFLVSGEQGNFAYLTKINDSFLIIFLVNHLTPGKVAITDPWHLILIYVALRFLQGGGTGGIGLLNNLKAFLWIKVQQFTSRTLQVRLFAHLHRSGLYVHHLMEFWYKHKNCSTRNVSLLVILLICIIGTDS